MVNVSIKSVPMTQSLGEYRHQCQFPPNKLGLQQDYEYHLVAGDAQTPRYKIDVRIAPAIVVDRVDYHCPSYTGIADQSVERQGDLRAMEGPKSLFTPPPMSKLSQARRKSISAALDAVVSR